MKLKRLAASISASFEDFVGRVENHEAVAEQVLSEARQSAARIQAQAARSAAQLAQLEERRERLLLDRDRWCQRALRFADTDEARALDCMERVARCEDTLTTLERQKTELSELNDRLSSSLRDVEQRLHDLRLRKASLSSRSARARALGSLDPDGAVDELERVFERWEIRVAADEYGCGPSAPVADGLDRELSETERREMLRQRLNELRSNAGPAERDA